MNERHAMALVLVCSAVTMGIRFLPFAVFGEGRKTPEFVTYLGRVLPYSMMGMLVVFCLKHVSLLRWPHGVPELLCCALTAGLHLWRRNTLLSIVAGTACYMLLVQLVFV